MARKRKIRIDEEPALIEQEKPDQNMVLSESSKQFEELKEDVAEIAESTKEIEEIKEDVAEIMEEVSDSSKDVEELKENVEEIKEDVAEISKSAKTYRELMEKLSGKFHLHIPTKFNINDVAQQIVGAMILSLPFTVTQEAWDLANQLDIYRIFLIIFITLLFDVLLIYFSKFQQIDISNIVLVFARMFSIILVSYIATAAVLYSIGVIGNQITDPIWALKLVILIGLPANIGAATADILK